MKCLCAVVPREEGENTRLILSDSDNLRTDVHIASDD
ncbi:MAG: SAM-dependent methyltransferase, partial [Thermoplasmata archaeon]|nr:SAM-dependent methyltransferase [Thermoplasmata archaeon]